MQYRNLLCLLSLGFLIGFLISTLTGCSRSSEEKAATSLFKRTENSVDNFLDKQLNDEKLMVRGMKYDATHTFNCSTPMGFCSLNIPQHIGSVCYCNDIYGRPIQGTAFKP